MNSENFMEQKASEMSIKELIDALKIKIKQSSEVAPKRNIKQINWIGHPTKDNIDSYTIEIDIRDPNQKELMGYILTTLKFFKERWRFNTLYHNDRRK